MKDDLKKKWETTSKSTKINLIGCDTIVNSPSSFPLCMEVLWEMYMVDFREGYEANADGKTLE